MIVRDEETNLQRALTSVAGLDAEIVVVDTGSVDGTVAVAERHGARVLHFAWVDDFAAARNFALAAAKGTWALVLDADEEVSAELREGIDDLLASTKADAIEIPVHNVDDQGRLQQRVPSVRFVRLGRGYAYVNRVHEDIEGPIRRSGGVVVSAELPLVHHGYTAVEASRKQRHQRNMRLVAASLEESPEDPRNWYYAGLEHAIAADYGPAKKWLGRIVDEQPAHPLAGSAASQLVAIHVSERSNGAAWEAAQVGLASKVGRPHTLLQLGELALSEGDSATAIAAALELERLPAHAAGDFEGRKEAAMVLRARALPLEEGYKGLARHVRKAPADARLGDALVRLAEKLGPPQRAAVTALRDAAGAPSVLAGTIGSFARQRVWDMAVQIGDKYGIKNEHYAHALVRTGRVEAAREAIASFGEGGGVLDLLLGFDTGDHRDVARGLANAPRRWAEAAELVLERRPVPRELAGVVHDWLRVALELRSDHVATRLARSLPGALSERRSAYAALAYEAGQPQLALVAALEHPGTLDSQEVMGLVALASGYVAEAAVALSARAWGPDPKVSVLLGAYDALKRTGRAKEAMDLLEARRHERPFSKALDIATHKKKAA